LKGCAIY